MNLHRFLILGAAVGALSACSSDSTAPKLVTPGPAALMHVINAVPDTGAMDFRFTDTIDGVPNVEFVNLPFRGGTNVGYQRVSPGAHHIRAFMNASNLNAAGLTNDPAIVSTVMGDLDFTFVDGVHYTIVLYGNSRSGAQKFAVITDSFVIPTSGISLRVLNATPFAADYYVTAATAAQTTVTGTPTFPAVPGPSDAAYQGFATALATSGYAVTATFKGATTPVWSALVPIGSAAVPEVTGVSGALSALPGSRITGSVFSAILFPASTAGSKAATFATPGVVIMADRFF